MSGSLSSGIFDILLRLTGCALRQAGLLTCHQQGNQQHYQANPDNPVFEELKAITRKTFGVQV